MSDPASLLLARLDVDNQNKAQQSLRRLSVLPIMDFEASAAGGVHRDHLGILERLGERAQDPGSHYQSAEHIKANSKKRQFSPSSRGSNHSVENSKSINFMFILLHAAFFYECPSEVSKEEIKRDCQEKRAVEIMQTSLRFE